MVFNWNVLGDSLSTIQRTRIIICKLFDAVWIIVQISCIVSERSFAARGFVLAIKLSFIENIHHSFWNFANLEVILTIRAFCLLFSPRSDAFFAEKSFTLFATLHVFKNILTDQAFELFNTSFEFFQYISFIESFLFDDCNWERILSRSF